MFDAEEDGFLEMDQKREIYRFKRDNLIECARNANKSAKHILQQMIKQLDKEFMKLDKQD
jgi:hypothetical protein